MAKFSTLSSGVSRRTSSHLTSSSSAMSCASAVPMCWPISALRMCMVVLPSGVIVNQIDGVNPGVAPAVALVSRLGNPMLRKVPAVVAAERTRKSRRVVPGCDGLRMARALLHDCGGAFHGTDDTGIGGAAAQVAVHSLDDLLIARARVCRQQRGGLHNLPGLAVTALGDLLLDPGLLHGMDIGGIETFDGGDARALKLTDGNGTGTDGLTADVHGA